MQHIINLAFDLDDEKIRQTAENAVQNEADGIIKEIFLDQIAPLENNYYGRKQRDWSGFNGRVGEIMTQFFNDKKEEIIELAATKLVGSLKRTNAWKKKYGEVIDDEP